MHTSDFERFSADSENYYSGDYIDSDWAVISEYFGREIAKVIYRHQVNDAVKEEMKRIFVKKENGEHLKGGAPKEIIKVILKET